MSTSRHCERYGEYYWCVKVPESVSPDGEIYVVADRVEIVGGALVCTGHNNQKEDDKELIYRALGPWQWLVFSAASVFDGAVVAVERWKGEINE